MLGTCESAELTMGMNGLDQRRGLITETYQLRLRLHPIHQIYLFKTPRP